MSISRREYLHSILVNGIKITKIVIDPHYEIKHSEVINDELIIKLVKTLDENFYDFIDEKDQNELPLRIRTKKNQIKTFKNRRHFSAVTKCNTSRKI